MNCSAKTTSRRLNVLYLISEKVIKDVHKYNGIILNGKPTQV